MRHLISLKDQSAGDLLTILQTARTLKEMRLRGADTSFLKGQNLIMLFQKSSTRTRLSFEAGMTELGGHGIFLDVRTSQFALTDFADEIRAVMRFGQVLMLRALKAADVEKAASYNTIPVIDGCSEKYHPCQALGDMLTMIEHTKGGLKNIRRIAWLGIENNVSNTLKLLCAKLGVEISIVSPGVDPMSVDNQLNELADKSGKVIRTTDREKGLKGAQFVHTDTWMNMEFFENGKVKPGHKAEYERRLRLYRPYQLNRKLLESFAPEARTMHCMPCHIGYEISRDAVDHPSSLIFEQAENRLHIQKAIILWLLGKERLAG